MAATALGIFTIMGGWGLTRDATYLYAQSTSHQSLHERTGQSLRDALRSYNLAIVTLVAGILCILLGRPIQTFRRRATHRPSEGSPEPRRFLPSPKR